MGNLKQRDCRFELIRIIACVFVLGVHTMWILTPEMGIKGLYTKIVDTLFITCNPIFFMMSGKFALRQAEYTDDLQYFRFYLKKLAYLILPLLVYMFFISATNLKMQTGSYSGLLYRFILDVISGHQATHLWFMYVLVGNVLMSPFTSRIFSSISRCGAIIFISILLLTNCAIAYSPYFFSTSFASWVNPFVGWSMYFYLGACVDKIFTDKKSVKILTIAGIIAFLIIMWKKYAFSYLNFIHDYMPSFTIFALMIYVLLIRMKVDFSEKSASIIRFLGAQSFGIYLIHFPIVFVLRDFIEIPSWCPEVIFQYFYMIIVFLICLLVCWIIGSFLLKPIQNDIEKLIAKIK